MKMTKINQIWKCNVCGNIIEILHKGADSLVCCNQPMVLQEENTKGEYAEKHAPIIAGKIVKIGNIPHPMEEKHYIEWVEATGNNNEKGIVFLKPGQEPIAEFSFEPTSARMYCNIHGLWKK